MTATSSDAQPSVRLVPAILDAPPGLEAFLREIGEGENGFGGELTFIHGERTLPQLLRSLVDASAGRGLPEGWVPARTCWLLDEGGAVIGMSRLRHEYTPFLREKGGLVGYYVKRTERGKGLGTKILAATLDLARNLGIDRVMIAAYADNAASIRVIEANGGTLEDERAAPDGHVFRRYWIELT
ncbi:MAG: GNAT family N-acetyltransferase [Dehalococcoidia bacterium]